MPDPSAPPRRIRLTVSNGQGKPGLRSGINDSDRTWLAIVPLESHCYAVRLGFANPFREPMPIAAAAVYPSDGYQPVTGAVVPGTSVGLPSGGASGIQVFFDGGGQDTPQINGAGKARGLVLTDDPENTGDLLTAFTIAWSDWAPLRSTPRADGGSNPLLFVYVALRAGSMTTAGFGPDPFVHATSSGSRGRVFVSLRGDLAGDWTQNPAGTAWRGAAPAPRGNGSQWGLSPLFCLQYRSVVPGFQGVISGDSLMCGPFGPNGDGYSAAPIRAAYDLSSTTLPVCVAHLGCGGVGSAVYNEALLRNLCALQPSFLVLQPLSRNNGLTQPSLDALAARLQATSDAAAKDFCARTVFQGAFPIPSVDPSASGDGSQLALWHSVRARIAAMEAAGIPAYDAAAIIGDANAPWRYRPECTDDDAHPNQLATDLITPTVRRVLRRLLFGELGIPL